MPRGQLAKQSNVLCLAELIRDLGTEAGRVVERAVLGR
jgi:hypothetical protein